MDAIWVDVHREWLSALKAEERAALCSDRVGLQGGP